MPWNCTFRNGQNNTLHVMCILPPKNPPKNKKPTWSPSVATSLSRMFLELFNNNIESEAFPAPAFPEEVQRLLKYYCHQHGKQKKNFSFPYLVPMSPETWK